MLSVEYFHIAILTHKDVAANDNNKIYIMLLTGAL